MSTSFSNHRAVNNLFKTFSKHFNFNDVKESLIKDRFNYILRNVYTSTSPDSYVTAQVIFEPQEKIKDLDKNYLGRLVFNTPYMMKEEYINIGSIIETMYQPDFNKIINVIDWFIDEGTKTEIIKITDKKEYSENIENHLNANFHTFNISTTSKNVAMIYFNNILQKGEGFKDKHFKKSYINIDLIYLVHSDNTMHPYFKIRLPYFDNKKISCVTPIGRSNKMYIYTDDKTLTTQHINQEKCYELNENDIRHYFNKLFSNQIINVLSNRLKISKKELESLSVNELKEYFLLVEMVKI